MKAQLLFTCKRPKNSLLCFLIAALTSGFFVPLLQEFSFCFSNFSTMVEEEHLQKLSEDLVVTLGLEKLTIPTYEQLLSTLSAKVTHFINFDFPALVQLLYQLDVDENDLRVQLKENNKEASNTIATLIIERQLVKIKTKATFKTSDNGCDEERW